MKYCSNCGSSNKDDAGFCNGCGSVLPLAENSDTLQKPQDSNLPQIRSGASGKAIAAMILGILSIISSCGPITGIAAIILANQELSAIRDGSSSPEGKILAQIGLWTGWVGTVVCGLGGLIYFLFSLELAQNMKLFF